MYFHYSFHLVGLNIKILFIYDAAFALNQLRVIAKKSVSLTSEGKYHRLSHWLGMAAKVAHEIGCY
jgi:hypothetical protein